MRLLRLPVSRRSVERFGEKVNPPTSRRVVRGPPPLPGESFTHTRATTDADPTRPRHTSLPSSAPSYRFSKCRRSLKSHHLAVVFPRRGSSSPSTMGCPYRRLISFSVTPDATSRFKSTTAAANSASLHSSVVSFGFPASSHRTYARIRHKSLGTSTASKSTSPFTASARARVVARRRAGRR